MFATRFTLTDSLIEKLPTTRNMRVTLGQKIVKVRLTDACTAWRLREDEEDFRKELSSTIARPCENARGRDNGKEFDARIMCFENRETAAALPRDIA